MPRKKTTTTDSGADRLMTDALLKDEQMDFGSFPFPFPYKSSGAALKYYQASRTVNPTKSISSLSSTEREGLRNKDLPIEFVKKGPQGITPTTDYSRRSGFDENFKTSEAFNWLARSGVGTIDDVTFADLFLFMRQRTHEVIFIDTEDKLSAHTGALIRDLTDCKSWVKAGEPSFHNRRQEVIEDVIKDQSIDDEIKPIKAATEALLWLISNTSGYYKKDDNGDRIIKRGAAVPLSKDRTKFRSTEECYTAFGLDLKNPQNAEAAFKTYQAARDKFKMIYVLLVAAYDQMRGSPLTGDNFLNALFTMASTEDMVKAVDADLNGRTSPVRAGTPFSDYCLDRISEPLCNIISEAPSTSKHDNTPLLRREEVIKTMLTLGVQTPFLVEESLLPPAQPLPAQPAPKIAAVVAHGGNPSSAFRPAGKAQVVKAVQGRI